MEITGAPSAAASLRALTRHDKDVSNASILDCGPQLGNLIRESRRDARVVRFLGDGSAGGEL